VRTPVGEFGIRANTAVSRSRAELIAAALLSLLLDLTSPAEAVSSFLAEYRDDRGRLPGASAWLLLVYLRAEGAVPPEPPAVVAPVEQLVGEYREWLACERGLAPVTVRASEHFARWFLAVASPHGIRAVWRGSRPARSTISWCASAHG
jgi:hypothetical protein